MDETAGKHGSAWHAQSAEQALAAFGSRREGLSADEVGRARARHGANRIEVAAGRPAWRRLLAQMDNLFSWVLLVAAAGALLLDHALDAVVIAAVVVVNVAVGFIQEGRAEQALAAVRGMLSSRATVRREGRRAGIDAVEVVPGDIVLLQAGDRVPADLRLLRASNLRIEESALTGESVAVGKDDAPVPAGAQLGDRASMAWSGTLVAAGSGEGVVVATGPATELGRISHLLAGVSAPQTPLLRQMNVFASRLTVVILVVSVIALLAAWKLAGYALDEAFMTAVGIAVAAIPEGLPVIVTITLALGVQRMAGRNAIVRQLPAVETLGSVSVICSDKTGTLTRNEMTVARVVTAAGDWQVEGVGYQPTGTLRALTASAVPPDDLARAAALCNDAALHERDGAWGVDGDPMEGALLVLAARTGIDLSDLASEWPRTDEVPFDAAHRYMATVHPHPDGGALLAVKGAPEQVLALCEGRTGGREPQWWHDQVESLGRDGQRVLALAGAVLPSLPDRLTADSLHGVLQLHGLVGLIDPPRAEAIAAVAECRQAGIEVKMITGDHAVTAAAIAAELGLAHAGDVVTGADLEHRDDAQLRRLALATGVFARTSPEHKLRLVQALQADGAVVAMTGDGVNDAPALKRADVGVAMGRTGTDVAKEAAKVVLVDDNFASIVAAVREGRTIYDNIKKSVAWALPTNGGEALVILAALAMGLTLPITPVQILWINMVTAVTLGLTFAFEPGEPDVMRRPPRPSRENLLSAFLLWRVVLVSVLFALCAFAVFAWAKQTGAGLEAARTLVVSTVVSLEVFYLFSIRFLHRSSLDWPGVLGTPAVLLAVAAVTVLQLAFVYLPPMQWLFDTRPLSLGQLLVPVLAGIALLTVLEIEKWLSRLLRGRRGA
ncbi:MAG: HAD-IC family P-type ATPase [Xanthomonadales bacterium]|nr:HAD-IC family P-type ATPase [Xanthomonadales bacterium]